MIPPYSTLCGFYSLDAYQVRNIFRTATVEYGLIIVLNWLWLKYTQCFVMFSLYFKESDPFLY